MKIIVSDTNILIDLAELNLLHDFTKLNFEFHTNDFIINEIQNTEQKKKVQEIIETGKLFIATTKNEQYEKIFELGEKNLSFEDCTIWYYAKINNGILLTGDGNLRKSAKKSGLEVRGIIYIFDKLIENNIINKKTALNKMTKLYETNKRLPKKEIEKRIKFYRNNLETGK